MLGQFVLQEFWLFLKCPLIQQQALSSRLDWLWMPLPNPHPALLPPASSGWKEKRRSPTADYKKMGSLPFPCPALHPAQNGFPELCRNLSRGQSSPEKCLTIPAGLAAFSFTHRYEPWAPGAFGDGSPGLHQFSASAPISSRCILLSVPALEIVCCTQSWENSSLRLLATPRCPGLAQVSGHVLRRLWHLKSSEFHSQFPEGVKLPQVLPWVLFYPDSSVQAAHGLCSGFIKHLKLPEAPHTSSRNR